LPLVIDDAAIELVNNLIKKKIENLDEDDFMEVKRRNIETLNSNRLLLQSVSKRYFNSILENNLNFPTYKKMEKFSSEITKKDLSFFYEDNLKNRKFVFTEYVKDFFILINFYLDVFSKYY